MPYSLVLLIGITITTTNKGRLLIVRIVSNTLLPVKVILVISIVIEVFNVRYNLLFSEVANLWAASIRIIFILQIENPLLS